MYRRNLDIFVAGGLALLGGAAYEAHVPTPVQVVLGIALFFAPGYLWSEAILSQRLPGLERVLTSAGLSLIFPIIGGFLFYGLRIPLLRPAWVGLLVVLTLLGVVAVAIQRLRQPVIDPRPAPGRRPQPPQPRPSRLKPLHIALYGLAALVALGSVGFSVHSAQTQKYPGTTAMGMPPVLVNPGEANPVNQLSTKANLTVTNHEGATGQFKVKLYRKGKLATTYGPFTLADGQTWKQVIAYTTAQNDGILAYAYLLPNTTTPVGCTDNGQGTLLCK